MRSSIDPPDSDRPPTEGSGTAVLGAPPAPVRWMRALEASHWPDRLTALYRPLAEAVAGPRDSSRDRFLTGRWLGHALHPVLVLTPVGMWSATTALDLVGGPSAGPAAQRLLGIGLLATPSAVATGLAEWRPTAGGPRRVGLAHAAANSGASTLMLLSYLARRRGSRTTGTVLALAGNSLTGLAGYLGGHLTVVNRVGSRNPTFDSRSAAG